MMRHSAQKAGQPLSILAAALYHRVFRLSPRPVICQNRFRYPNAWVSETSFSSGWGMHNMPLVNLTFRSDDPEPVSRLQQE